MTGAGTCVQHAPVPHQTHTIGGRDRMATRQSISERFWSKVDKREPSECWEWQGTRSKQDYGSMSANIDGRSKGWRAHRLSFLLANGYVPSLVMHTCDNPPCVNPAHLKAGTPLENTRDARDKGRLNPHNSHKTHCPNGHPYDEQNAGARKVGGRSCRECQRVWRRAHAATVLETIREESRNRHRRLQAEANALGLSSRQYTAFRKLNRASADAGDVR